MIFPAAFGGPALFLLAGLGIAELVPALRRRPFLLRLGWAYLLGVALVSGALYLLSHALGLPLSPGVARAAFAFPVLAGTAARLVRREPHGAQRRSGRRWKPLERVLLLSAGLVTIGLLADAVTNPILDWDGRMTWVAHARYVRAAQGVDALALRDGATYVPYPRYPLLLPVAIVAEQQALGMADDERSVRPLFAAFFPAFLLVALDGLAFLAGRTAAAAAVLAAALVPQVGFSQWGGAASAYCDLPLACFFGGAFFLLVSPRPRLAEGLAAGLLLGAALLTKNEGAPLALVAFAVAAVFRGGRPAARPALGAAALVAALAVVLLLSWRSGIPFRLTTNEGGLHAPLAAFAASLRRFPAVAGPIARELLLFDSWGLFWPAAAGILLLGGPALAGRRARPFVVALGLALPVYLAAYGATEMNLASLVPTTWNRFMLQVSMPVLALLALAFRRATRAPRDATPGLIH